MLKNFSSQTYNFSSGFDGEERTWQAKKDKRESMLPEGRDLSSSPATVTRLGG